MTRKHFKLLAEAIAAEPYAESRRRLCERIGHICAELNPRFRWATWNAACGVVDTKTQLYEQLRANGWTHEAAKKESELIP